MNLYYEFTLKNDDIEAKKFQTIIYQKKEPQFEFNLMKKRNTL